MHGPTPTGSTAPVDSFRYAYLWAIALVAALGGLLFGYDWVVIGGAKPFFEPYFGLTTEVQVGWANSCALLGCLVGSLVAGGLSDRYGRKRLLLVSGLLFAVSSVFTGWAYSFTAFVVWRIAGGVAIGMASNLSPLYIAEVAPAQLRGRLVAMNQMTIVLGILAAQIANWLIAERMPAGATADFIRQSWTGQFGWRWMFTAVAAPSVVFFLSAMLVPESPRWLTRAGRFDEALAVLGRIGGTRYAMTELAQIQATLADETSSVGLSDLLAPSLRKVLLVGCALAVLQQWCGINVLFNYAEEIYRSAGYEVSEVMFTIVITGSVNLLFTLLALGTIDSLGRRTLMLAGCASIGLAHLLLGFAYYRGMTGMPVLVFTLAAIGCYAMSLAPVTWVLISEIFPNRVRGSAVSVAVSSLWIACFVLIYTFPKLKVAAGMAAVFWIYAGICLAGFVFVCWAVPETKGKSLEQIEREMTG